MRCTPSSPPLWIIYGLVSDTSIPRLFLAGIVPGVMVGVGLMVMVRLMADRYDLPKAEDLDGLENVRATRHVSANLSKSLDALEKDSALKAAVGDLLVDALVFLKRDEVKRLAGKTVDEVRDYYLPFV